MENGGQGVVRKVKRKAFFYGWSKSQKNGHFSELEFVASLIFLHFKAYKCLNEMRTKIALYRFCFVTETLSFFNMVFPSQYLKVVLNILICRHTLPLYVYVFVVLEKDVVIFSVLTDSN